MTTAFPRYCEILSVQFQVILLVFAKFTDTMDHNLMFPLKIAHLHIFDMCKGAAGDQLDYQSSILP